MRDELVVYLEKVSVATAAAASEAGIVEVAFISLLHVMLSAIGDDGG